MARLAPGLRGQEWVPPRWLMSRARLAQATPALKGSQLPGGLPWIMWNRPGAHVIHIVRHPGGFLSSWMSRFLERHDRDETAAAINERHGAGRALAVTANIASKDDLQRLVDGLAPLEQPEGLPAVSESDDGGVEITLPDSDPPSSLEVWTVIRGDGPQVSPDQRVVLQYTAVTWSGGEIYDSTWADGQVPRSVLLDETFAGLRDGLTDQTVGSRTAIIVPPALGTGSQTLVFAVDILAATDVE